VTAAEALRAAGLHGWKALTKPLDEATGYVTVLTSPDYDPTAKPPKGRLFAGRADTEHASLDLAMARAISGLAIQ
jgi:hypothetical protein